MSCPSGELGSPRLVAGTEKVRQWEKNLNPCPASISAHVLSGSRSEMAISSESRPSATRVEGFNIGIRRGYIGIMENKMETAI